MRIVLILSVGIDRPSGRRYFNLARELARQGHRVRLLALHPDFRHAAPRFSVREGVEIWYVGQMHVRKMGSRVERFGPLAMLRVLFASTWGLVWAILRSPADVYHVGKPQPLNGVAAVIGVLLLRGQRFYLDCDDDEVYSNRFTAGWQRAVFAFWQRTLPYMARALTVNTRYLAARVAPLGKPVVHVPNGVNLARMATPAPHVVDGLRRALGLADAQVIVYVGTLALQNHPVDLLLQAFDQLAPQLPAARLLMVGSGDDLPVLQRWAATHGLRDRVLFTGEVPHTLVAYLLALGAVSVDPVHDDPVARARSPLKLFESMALGVPVITGDVGDRAELLDYGRAGCLAPPGDVPALVQALHSLLTDETRHAALAAHARCHVRRYDWANLAATWRTVYAPAGEQAPQRNPAIRS